MKNILALASICVGLVCAQAPAPHQKAIVFSDGGGAIAHFLDGDGWKTTLTLVNLDATQASFTISFFGDDGNPLAFNINGVLTSTLSGVISARGAYAMTTSGTKTALSEGWAKTFSYNTIGGTAVFQRLGQNQEASEVLETNLSAQLVLPFDHTNGYATGVALVNPFSYESIPVTVTFRDQYGNIFLTDTFTLSQQQHIGITLTQRYPASIGAQGTVTFTTSALWLNALGMRFSPAGFFSTVTPLSAVGW